MTDAVEAADETANVPASPPTSKAQLGLAIALLAMAILIGVLATFGIGHDGERAAMKAVAFRQSKAMAIPIDVTQWVTWFGDASQRTLAMAAFAAFLFWKKRARAALVMLVIPPIAGATSSILKEIFARERPDIVPHLDMVTSLSYPSGHAVNVMVTYLLAALLIGRASRSTWIFLALLVALLIGVSRILLGVHWPSDMVGGWCWGAGVALLGAALARRLEARV